MYGRLSQVYGWAWQHEDGTLGPFILYDVEKYAGMIAGYTPDGRKCARPSSEFDSLSHDGKTWHPTQTLLAQVPKENDAPGKLRQRDLPLPLAFDEDQ